MYLLSDVGHHLGAWPCALSSLMPVVSQHFFTYFSLFLLSLPSPVRSSLESLLSVAELTLLQGCLCHSGSWSSAVHAASGGHLSSLLHTVPICFSATLGSCWPSECKQSQIFFPLPSFPGLPVWDWGSVWILFWLLVCEQWVSLPSSSLSSLLCQNLASPSKLTTKLSLICHNHNE